MAHSRKLMLFGVGLTGGVIALSSAAFACTVWVGSMTVTGNRTAGTNGPSVTVQGGNATTMTYCNIGGEPAGKASITHPAAGTTESLRIRIGKAQWCNGPDVFNPTAGQGTGTANVFPPGTYFVTYDSTGFEYTNVADNPLSRQYTRDCMKYVANPGGGGTPLASNNVFSRNLLVNNGTATITVSGTYTADQTYTNLNHGMAKNLWDETAPFTTDESAVCVSNIQTFNGKTTQFGNQAPFFVF